MIKHRLQQRFGSPLPPPRFTSDLDMNPDWADEAAKRFRDLRAAAVLVPLVDRSNDISVLLTQRADTLTNHSGQVAFPGGRIDPGDPGPVGAALREAEEEIGLTADFVSVIGQLPAYRTGTGFEVTPVVSMVEPGFDLVPNPAEVAEIFEVPLDFVLDDRNHRLETRRWRGKDRYFYAMEFDGHRIWGATAAMLLNLHHLLTFEEA